MEKRTGPQVSDEQRVKLMEEVSANVKSLNPSTKTITSVDKTQLYLAKKFAMLKDLDVVVIL